MTSACADGACSQRKVWERLKMYEDTGLEPDRICEFMEKWVKVVELAGLMKQEGIEHLRELVRAEKDSRLVVLDEPKRPLVWGDDNHDTVLCPRCLCDLMGGFEFAPDSDTEMFQCPHCGQPIDSREVITFEESEAALRKDGAACD